MQNPMSLYIPLFLMLFCLVLVWFALLQLLFKRLKTTHPTKYDAMGKPALFSSENPAGFAAVLKFILTREHKTLGDAYLSRLSYALLAIFVIYLLLFLVLILIGTGKLSHFTL